MKMIVHGTGYHHPFLLGQSFDATRWRKTHRSAWGRWLL